MHTEIATRIHGPMDTVFAYAARVEDWPRLLPHYRGVRIVEARGNSRVVEMRARRGAIPVWWWARQVVLPAEGRIRYTHVRGVTTGMEVEWRLARSDEGVVVTIVHDLFLRWPVVGRAVADWIIGPQFVGPISAATLRRIKWLVEQPATSRGEAARHGGVRR